MVSGGLMETKKTDYVKGLDGVVAAQTALSLVDGEKGRLLYRGIPIHELAVHSTFEEIIYFLFYGKLPLKDELEKITRRICQSYDLPKEALENIRRLPSHIHPMAMLRTIVSSLAYYDNDADNLTRESLLDKGIRLIARMPTIVAAYDRSRKGKEPVAPRADLSVAANFLYMLHGHECDPKHVHALDAYLVMLADHGLNASTFSARVTISTLSDLYSAITAAIGTLKGVLHGSANEKAMRMFMEIGEEDKAEAYVMELLKDHKKVMGIGHRVYKTQDPRAKEFRRVAEEVCMGTSFEKWLKISYIVEEVVWREKKIPANVDFYSASMMYALGIDVDLFTTIFAMSRVSGWTAHVMEQLEDNRLIRPQADYTGPADAHYVPIDKRG